VRQTVFVFTDTTSFGGSEQMVLTLLEVLDRSLWRPVLVYRPHPGVMPLVERARKLDVNTMPVPAVGLEGKQGLRQMLRFVRVLRRERPAVFHAHLCGWPRCTFGILAAILARVPAIVATQHFFQGKPSRHLILRQQVVFLGVHRYIAVSHDMAMNLRNTLRFTAPKMQVVHNGITLAPFSRPGHSSWEVNRPQGGRGPSILTLARLIKNKGLSYLISAAVLVPEAVFVVVGEGHDRGLFEAEAEALGVADRVKFLGQRDDIPDLLRDCDLFILPSLHEGLPISVLEAMAAGKPVIATAIGGIPEVVVRGQTGLLVPPADPPALAKAIRTLLGDPILARDLGTAGRARVQREFSAELMVQRTTQIYSELLLLHYASSNRKADLEPGKPHSPC
jgi:glycosyltransferase involved in cell wall biosynthesis